MLKGQIVFDRSSGKFGLFVLSWGQRGHERPEGKEDGNRGENGKEDCSLESTAKLPGKVPGHNCKYGEESFV